MSDEATPTPEDDAEKAEATTEAEVETEAEAEVEAEAEPEAETEAEPEVAEPEVKAEAEPEAKAEAKPKNDNAPAAEKPAEGNTLSTTMVPPEYVPAVRRGRNRRINIDINLNDVHYKNIPLLTRFLDPYGRILSRRKTKVSAKVQRRAVTAIKQARHLSLLPYTGDHTRLTRRKRR